MSPPLRTYGRIKSRSLKPRQARLIGELLPKLAVPEEPFDPLALAPGASEAWLEAGFGAGEHLTTQAQRHPHVLLLGAEPFVNGLGACLAHIDDLGATNVRLQAGD
ncbi:MAG TPA: tRNA (guanosine(46)-N7)-methyltransferase TrmB, partial [Caulobacteraceae bacterium]|nr:tRNA (guanosine(46)-N7)-methyltransferase TrmB [Caulobacteraceae bacterium]